MSRVGVFSGTFDPVHNGHIEFAQAASRQCALDSVIFLPEREPRGKLLSSDFEHRMRMLELAIKGHDAFFALALDHKKFTTTETLPHLRGLYPGDKLVLLIGSDTVKTFSYRWPGLRQLLQEMELAIGLRAEEDERLVQDAMTSLDVSAQFTIVLAGEFAQASATAAREGRLDIIPPIVLDYIKERNLYTQI